MKKEFQKGIQFNNLREFFDFLPEQQLAIVEFLRHILFSIFGDTLKEKLSYNVPFYYIFSKRTSFIWPSVIPWSGVKEGVTMGLCNAHLFLMPNPYFLFEKRKQVAMATFKTLKEAKQKEKVIYKTLEESYKFFIYKHSNI